MINIILASTANNFLGIDLNSIKVADPEYYQILMAINDRLTREKNDSLESINEEVVLKVPVTERLIRLFDDFELYEHGVYLKEDLVNDCIVIHRLTTVTLSDGELGDEEIDAITIKVKHLSDFDLTMRNLILLRDAWIKNDFEPKMVEFGGINAICMDKAKIKEINICGTNCCILGYAPNVKGLEIEESDFTLDGFTFNYWTYSNRIFPALGVGFKWDFVFSKEWDDNKYQAIKRMTYLIDNKLEVPCDWNGDGDFYYTL